MLCDSLEGCCGEGGGRGLQEGGDTCIPMADFRWCMGFYFFCDPSGFSFVKPMNNLRYVPKSFIEFDLPACQRFEGTAGPSSPHPSSGCHCTTRSCDSHGISIRIFPGWRVQAEPPSEAEPWSLPSRNPRPLHLGSITVPQLGGQYGHIFCGRSICIWGINGQMKGLRGGWAAGPPVLLKCCFPLSQWCWLPG